MVLALSGSAVGRTYLAQQHELIQDLLSLLHTASPRVQRQVGVFLVFDATALSFWSHINSATHFSFEYLKGIIIENDISI